MFNIYIFIKRKYYTLKEIFNKHGISAALELVFQKFGFINKVDRLKLRINKIITKKTLGVIQYGIFKGMTINHYESTWGGRTITSKLLGHYERQVSNHLVHMFKTNKNKTFYNFGAADGYYSIGVLYSKLADKSINFEENKKAHDIIKKNANINLCENQIKIYNKITKQKILIALEKIGKPGVLLCDVEGYEFNLFDKNIFNKLNHTHIIIEIHKFNKYFLQLKKKLIIDSKDTHNLKIIKSGNINCNDFIELENYSDDERALIFSEGRLYNMEWFILYAKNS